MAGWLILQLSRGPEERCSWMLADVQGQALGAPQSGALSAVAAQAVGRSIGVVVPNGDVLLTELELPTKGGVRPQQLVAFALEEQLAADIETLHFALGARTSRGSRMAVAVVTRALMDEWLGTLRVAGLSADVMCAEATLLPDNPSHTLLLLDGDTLCLRRAGHAAVALPADDIVTALEVSVGAELAGEHLICYATPQDWQQRGRAVEALRAHCASLKVQLLNSGALPLLAPQLAAGQLINLMSDDYAPKQTDSGGWRRWRLAAVLALALFAVHVAGLSLELLQQHRSERLLDAAIGEFAHSAIPGDSGQGAVRSRVEQRLLAARSAGGSGLMSELAALGQALGGVNGAALQALSYRDGGLDLKLRVSDAGSLERIDQALRNRGWQAELISGAAAGGAYEGRMQMRPAGAGPAPVGRPR